MPLSIGSYSTGTVTVVQNNRFINLAGAGAAWLAAWALPGCPVAIQGEAQVNYIKTWVSTTQVELILPVARTGSAGLTYSILLAAPAFGTNLEASMTNVERIRLQNENTNLQSMGAGTAAEVAPALGDRLLGYDVSNADAVARFTLAAALAAGRSIRTVAANYVPVATDAGQQIYVDASAAPRTITLPSAPVVGAGYEVSIMKVDGTANAVTIASGETINNLASITLANLWEGVTVRSTGATWRIISHALNNYQRGLLSHASSIALLSALGGAALTGAAFSGDVSVPTNTGKFSVGTFAHFGTLFSSAYSMIGSNVRPRVGSAGMEIANTHASYAGAAMVVQGNQGFEFHTAPAGSVTVGDAFSSPRVRITAAGVLEVVSGQIKMPAVQLPSADANTFDDYEEGTFTPALAFGGGVVGLTYSSRFGKYVKVGKLCQVWISMTLSAKGSSVGTATITGLPFVSAGGTSFYAGTIGYTSTTGSGTPTAAVLAGGSTVNLYLGAGVLSDTNFGNTTSLHISAAYEAAA